MEEQDLNLQNITPETDPFYEAYKATKINAPNINPIGGKYAFDEIGKFDDNFRIGVKQDANRERNQSSTSAIANAIGQSLSEVGLGTIEGLGYLGDLPSLVGVIAGSEKEFSNWLSDWAASQKENVREAIPIHREQKEFDKWDLGDRRWWSTVLPDIANSLSFFIPSTAVGKTASLAGKGLKYGAGAAKWSTKADELIKAGVITVEQAKGLKAFDNVTQGIVGGLTSRYMESMLEANGNYQQAITQGKSIDEAAEIAQNTYGANMWLAAVDMFQFTQFARVVNPASKAAKKARSLKKRITDNGIETFKQAAPEGFEEALQYSIGKVADKTDGGLNTLFTGISSIPEFSDESEFWESVTLGAIGGGAFHFGGKALNKLGGALTAKLDEANETFNEAAKVEKKILEAQEKGDLTTARVETVGQFIKLYEKNPEKANEFLSDPTLDPTLKLGYEEAIQRYEQQVHLEKTKREATNDLALRQKERESIEKRIAAIDPRYTNFKDRFSQDILAEYERLEKETDPSDIATLTAINNAKQEYIESDFGDVSEVDISNLDTASKIAFRKGYNKELASLELAEIKKLEKENPESAKLFDKVAFKQDFDNKRYTGILQNLKPKAHESALVAPNIGEFVNNEIQIAKLDRQLEDPSTVIFEEEQFQQEREEKNIAKEQGLSSYEESLNYQSSNKEENFYDRVFSPSEIAAASNTPLDFPDKVVSHAEQVLASTRNTESVGDSSISPLTESELETVVNRNREEDSLPTTVGELSSYGLTKDEFVEMITFDDSQDNEQTVENTKVEKDIYADVTGSIPAVVTDVELKSVNGELRSPIGLAPHKYRPYTKANTPKGFIYRPEILRNLHTKVDNVFGVPISFILSTSNGSAFGNKKQLIDKAAKSLEDADIQAIDVDVVIEVNGEKFIVAKLSRETLTEEVQIQNQEIKRELLIQYKNSSNKNNVTLTSKYKSNITLLGNSKRSFSNTWTDVKEVVDKEDKLNIDLSGNIIPIILAVRDGKITKESLNDAYSTMKDRLGKVKTIRTPNVSNRTGGFYLVVTEPDGSLSTVPLKTKEVRKEDLKEVFEKNNIDEVIRAIDNYRKEGQDVFDLLDDVIKNYKTDSRLEAVKKYFNNQQAFNVGLKDLFRFKILNKDGSISIAPDVGKKGFFARETPENAPIIFRIFAEFSENGVINYENVLEGFRKQKNQQAVINYRLANPNATKEEREVFEKAQYKKPLIQHINLDTTTNSFDNDMNKLQSNTVAGVPFHSPVIHTEYINVTTATVEIPNESKPSTKVKDELTNKTIPNKVKKEKSDEEKRILKNRKAKKLLRKTERVLEKLEKGEVITVSDISFIYSDEQLADKEFMDSQIAFSNDKSKLKVSKKYFKDLVQKYERDITQSWSLKEQLNNDLKNINSTFGELVTLEQLEDLMFYIETRISSGKGIDIVQLIRQFKFIHDLDALSLKKVERVLNNSPKALLGVLNLIKGRKTKANEADKLTELFEEVNGLFEEVRDSKEVLSVEKQLKGEEDVWTSVTSERLKDFFRRYVAGKIHKRTSIELDNFIGYVNAVEVFSVRNKVKNEYVYNLLEEIFVGVSKYSSFKEYEDVLKQSNIEKINEVSPIEKLFGGQEELKEISVDKPDLSDLNNEEVVKERIRVREEISKKLANKGGKEAAIIAQNNIKESATKLKEEVNGTIEENVWEVFVNTGKVESFVLDMLADKIEQNISLSKKEISIYSTYSKEVEYILKTRNITKKTAESINNNEINKEDIPNEPIVNKEEIPPKEVEVIPPGDEDTPKEIPKEEEIIAPEGVEVSATKASAMFGGAIKKVEEEANKPAGVKGEVNNLDNEIKKPVTKKKRRKRVKGKRKGNANISNIEKGEKLKRVNKKGRKRKLIQPNRARVEIKRITGIDDVSFTDTLIQIGNIQAYGIAKRASIVLSKLAPIGTDYHEAFHIVFGNTLPESVKVKLLKLASKRNVTQSEAESALETLVQLAKKYPDSKLPTPLEIILEERLADSFEEWKLDRENKTVLGKLFSDLFNLIKRLVGIDSGKLHKVFKSIDKGKYATTFINKSNVIRERYSKKNVFTDDALNTQEYINETANIVVGLMHDQIIQLVHNNNKSNGYDSSTLINVYKQQLESEENILNSILEDNDGNEYGVVAILDKLVELGKLDEDLADDIIVDLEDKGEIYKAVLRTLPYHGISLSFDGGYDSTLEQFEEIEETGKESWQTKVKIKPTDTLKANILRFLSTIPIEGKDKGGMYKIFNLNEKHNPKDLFNYLYAKLGGVADVNTLAEKMYELREDAVIKFLYDNFFTRNEGLNVKRLDGEAHRFNYREEMFTSLFIGLSQAHPLFKTLLLRSDNNTVTDSSNNTPLGRIRLGMKALLFNIKHINKITEPNFEEFKQFMLSSNFDIGFTQNNAKEVYDLYLKIDRLDTIENQLEFINNPTSSKIKEVYKTLAELYPAKSDVSHFFNGAVIYEIGKSAFIHRWINKVQNDSVTYYKELKKDEYYKNLPILQSQKVFRDWINSIKIIKYSGQSSIGTTSSVEAADYVAGQTLLNDIESFYNNGNKDTKILPLLIQADSGNKMYQSYKSVYKQENLQQAIVDLYKMMQNKPSNDYIKVDSNEGNYFNLDTVDIVGVDRLMKTDVIRLVNFLHNKGVVNITNNEDVKYISELVEVIDLASNEQLNTHYEKVRSILETSLSDVILSDNAVKGGLLPLLESYTLNKLYYGTTLNLLTAGDLSYYKKGQIEKRAKGQTSPINHFNEEASYRYNGTDYSHKTLLKNADGKVEVFINEDVEYDSPQSKELKEIGGDSVFDGRTSYTDASSYVDVNSMIAFLVGEGRVNDKKIQELIDINDGKHIVNTSIESVMKMYYFNMTQMSDGKTTAPFQMKDSTQVIFPQVGLKTINGRPNTQFNPYKKKILEGFGYVFTEDSYTYNKDLRRFDYFTHDTALKVAYDKKKAKLNAEKFNVEKANYDTPYDVDYTERLDFAHMGRQGETPEKYKDSKANKGTQIMKLVWQLTGLGGIFKTAYDRFQESMNKEIEAAYEEFLDKIGYDRKANTYDRSKVIQVLKDELISRGETEKLLALENNDSDIQELINQPTKLSLDHPAISRKLHSLLYAVARKKISRRKFQNGTSLVNASPVGLPEHLIPKIKYNKKGVPSSGISHYEVIQPIHDERLEIFAENGFVDLSKEVTYKGTTKTIKEHIETHDDFSVVIESKRYSLLDGINYRVPTENFYSIFKTKVKAFQLTNTSTIIAPPELVLIAGLDYDVDKFFGMYIAPPQSFELWSKKNGGNVGEYQKYVDSVTRDNAQIAAMMEVLTQPETAKLQLQTGNFDKQKEINRNIRYRKLSKNDRIKFDSYKGNIRKQDNFLNAKDNKGLHQMSEIKQAVIEENMAMGKAVLGIAANINAALAEFHHREVDLVKPIKINNKTYYKLSENVKDKIRVIGSHVGMLADNGKDPQANYFNLNTYTASVFYTMVLSGVPQETASKILAHPVIKKMSDAYYNNGKSDAKAKKIQIDLKFKFDNDKGLSVNVNSPSFYESNGAEIAAFFIELKENQAAGVNSFVNQVKKGDKGLASTIGDSYNLIKMDDLAPEDPMTNHLIGYQEVLNAATYINKMTEYGINEAGKHIANLVNAIYPDRYATGINQTFYHILNNIKSYKGTTISGREVQNMYDFTQDVILATYPEFKYDTSFVNEFSSLLIRRINKYVKDGQQIPEFIKRLTPSTIKDGILILEFDNNIADGQDLDIIRNSFEALKTNNEKLYTALIRYGMMTQGMSITATNWTRFIPLSYWIENTDLQIHIEKQKKNPTFTSDDVIRNFIFNNPRKATFIQTYKDKDARSKYFKEGAWKQSAPKYFKTKNGNIMELIDGRYKTHSINELYGVNDIKQTKGNNPTSKFGKSFITEIKVEETTNTAKPITNNASVVEGTIVPDGDNEDYYDAEYEDMINSRKKLIEIQEQAVRKIGKVFFEKNLKGFKLSEIATQAPRKFDNAILESDTKVYTEIVSSGKEYIGYDFYENIDKVIHSYQEMTFAESFEDALIELADKRNYEIFRTEKGEKLEYEFYRLVASELKTGKYYSESTNEKAAEENIHIEKVGCKD